MIEKLKDIKKGTLVRAILLILVLINMIASKAAGKELFFVDENRVTEIMEIVIAVAAIAAGYWKNNSYSKNAIAADDVLKSLNESKQTLKEMEENIEVFNYFDESEDTDDEG